MGSILNKPASPEMFYIYRVTNAGDNPTIEYKMERWGWTTDFHKAQFRTSFARTKTAAEGFASCHEKGVYINIGRATIEIDPLYNINTFEGQR